MAMTLETKKCSQCKEVKLLNHFHKDKSRKDGHNCRCKECAKENSAQWYKNNKEHRKQYLKDNKEYIKQYRNQYQKQYMKQYREDNKEHIKQYKNQYQKQYREDNITIRISHKISNAVRRSLRKGKNGRHWEDLLGYTAKDLKKHLENQFMCGMSWGNYGKWHLDHIIPISLWNFKTYTDREFKQCWALANLQPLWAEENLRKSNKTQGGLNV